MATLVFLMMEYLEQKTELLLLAVKRKILTVLLISASFFGAEICYSQEFDFNIITNELEKRNYTKLDSIFREINTSKITKYEKATLFYYQAYYLNLIDKQDLAYEKILKSKDIFQSINKLVDVLDCNILIFKIKNHQNDLKYNNLELLDETQKLALKLGSYEGLSTTYKQIASNYIDIEEGEKAIVFFRKMIPIVLKLEDTVRVGYCYENIATSHKYTTLKNLDSTFYYMALARKYYIKYGDHTTLAQNYNNMGQLYKELNLYDKAILFLKKADSIILKDNVIKNKIIFYENIVEAYDSINDYKNLSLYLKKLQNLKDSINDYEQNIAISDLDKKYKTLEKEKEILEKRNWLIILISIIGTILVVSFFYLKNSRKKHLLAIQEKELANQKNLTLLKEQEITTINAMVEGQEKERKRVAEDLHDNLGSVIATLKLHFDNLRMNREKKMIDQETLFDKTESLIDEAYKKVRNIAHAKNAGVIANQGLLTAVEMMAEKISSATNDFEIQVVYSGLDTPLENSLEIALFRIIQELTTNIIKHADASFVTIGLNEHQEGINIMIEDNGKGMKVSQIDLKKGMGLHSIQTRVEHLKGDFTIDSTPTKGTTVIINVPT